MSLSKFINYNKECPICGNKLSLYLQIISLGATTWKGELVGKEYIFEPHSKNLNENDFFTIPNLEDFEIKFNSTKSVKLLKTSPFHIFYICNEKGMEDNNYINVYESCYYRASPLFDYSSDTFDRFKILLNEDVNVINSEETFSITKIEDDSSLKIYTIINSEKEKDTKFIYYKVNDEELKNDNFIPKIHEKNFSYKKIDFSYENRDALYVKFDTWLLME